MAVTFRAASGGQSSTTATAASVTKPAGVLAGDLVIVGLTVKDAQTFTTLAGWTLEQNANSNSNVMTTAAYRRVLDGAESWPVSFAWTGSSVKYAWVAAGFIPGAGSQMTVDGEAAVKVDTTATTHTANAQTAVAGSVCSVLFNLGRNSASGATGATVTPPSTTPYTEPANGDQTTASGTTTALSQVHAEVCYRTGQSGTVTPSAATYSLTSTANTYHFLITDANLTATAGLATATGTAQAAAVPETSPALELSSFGSFSPIASGAAITDVTATVSQFSSSALMAAPTYELWDAGSAIIGAAQTGAASTTSTHTDAVVFTGVTYAQLGTLRLRIYGHSGAAGSGETLSVDSASLTVRFMPGAPAGGGTAGLATATGTAQAATVAVATTAGLATATGTAQAGTVTTAITATAGLATATGTALNPAATTSGSTTATAGLATAAGTALQTAQHPAGLATATGTAQAAAVTVATTAGLATATASAQFTPGTSVSILAIADTPVTATATALNASVSTSSGTTATAGLATATGTALQTAQHPAGLATATATALNATVSTSGNTVANAQLATATGTAQPPVSTISVTGTGLATATGTAQAPVATTAITATAGLATATGTAPPGTVTVTATAGLATATGTALNATVSTSGNTVAHAVLATAGGTAQPGTVTTAITASAGLATATGTAAGIGHGTVAGLATATGTAQAAALAVVARAAAAQALAAALDGHVPVQVSYGQARIGPALAAAGTAGGTAPNAHPGGSGL